MKYLIVTYWLLEKTFELQIMKFNFSEFIRSITIRSVTTGNVDIRGYSVDFLTTTKKRVSATTCFDIPMQCHDKAGFGMPKIKNGLIVALN